MYQLIHLLKILRNSLSLSVPSFIFLKKNWTDKEKTNLPPTRNTDFDLAKEDNKVQYQS